MKKLIALLLFCFATTSLAQDLSWFARANTTKGGKIVLLMLKGNCTGTMYSMYVSAPDGRMWTGCWFMTDNHIMAIFDDGSPSMAYDYSGWTINPALENRQGSRF